MDKRLVLDGKGLVRNNVINDNFVKFSESLLIAERNSRKEIEERAKINIKIAKKRKEKHENESQRIYAKEERERIRKKRKYEREREYRLEQRKNRNKKIRDISEKIALGELNDNNNSMNDTSFDSRLYNNVSGLKYGLFGNNNEYNV